MELAQSKLQSPLPVEEMGSIDENFMLRGRPGIFCAGEMLDWDAPTEGTLLPRA